MKTVFSLLSLLSVLSVAADGGRVGSDLKKLDGTWLMVSGAMDGKELPEEIIKTARLVIDGDKHTVKVGAETFVGTHKLDPAKKPKTIDATDTAGPFKGKTALGIYQLKDDEFKVCFAPPGKDRPKQFTSKGGSGIMCHVWTRAKD